MPDPFLRAAILLLLAVMPATGQAPVGPVPDPVRRELGLDPFYAKYIDASGLPVLGSARVSDHALREAAWIVQHMLAGREDILRTMAANKVRLVVMAHDEYTTDLPEHRRLQPAVYWNRRARGLGASLQCPVVSCAEENLLGYPGDPYATENICIHEFAHAVLGTGLAGIDAAFESRLRRRYDDARGRGLWHGTYAGSNPAEYWAEAVQSWFDDNRQDDSLHNHVNTRDELKAYDPDLASLCAEVFGDRAWRYRRPQLRPAAERAHLPGLDPARAPRFAWREAPVVARPKVLIQTSLGDIEVELDAGHAPVSTRNFLRYVHEGLYAEGMFHRTLTAANQPDDPVRIEIVQARADPARGRELHAAIGLERTRDTGLRHVDGAIAMARTGPDSAQDRFFFCIGDQPELDFGGRHHADGQGCAVFGRVVRGMEVVRKIHAGRADGQELAPPILIQRAIRTN